MAVGLVAQQDNDRAVALAMEIRETLAERGVPVHVDAVTAEARSIPGRDVDELRECELVASIGGDGTFLFTARAVGETPIVGINLGEVGFLNAVAPADATEAVADIYEALAAGEAPIQKLPRVIARGDGWELGPALNEIILHAPMRASRPRLAYRVTVDGKRLTDDAGDGIMVATPTGSTAYNLSERGPLLSPKVDGLVVTAMSGRNPTPPTVIPIDATVTFTLEGPEDGVIICDGRRRKSVPLPTTVTVVDADRPVHVAGPPVAFFDALEKLG